VIKYTPVSSFETFIKFEPNELMTANELYKITTLFQRLSKTILNSI